jgi:hypothetical protein
LNHAAACVETNREKLTDLVHQVEEAFFQRGQELAHRANHAEERNAMVQASENLLVIQTEMLSWPTVEMKQFRTAEASWIPIHERDRP